MISLSKYAEDLNHHPEWTNVYNKVDVLLSTHDVQGLTKKDFLLAEIMNELFLKYSIEIK
jgi:4a-hydroxytetrahydrobiopterin dehydratase